MTELKKNINCTNNDAEIELSVVMPCLNEEKTIGECIRKAKTAIDRLAIRGEIVIADNGSTDRSVHSASDFFSISQVDVARGSHISDLDCRRNRVISGMDTVPV